MKLSWLLLKRTTREVSNDILDTTNLTPVVTLVCLFFCSSSGISVSLVGGGTLCWPVYFVYPEFGESDFIEQFPETDKSVLSHLYIKTPRYYVGY